MGQAAPCNAARRNVWLARRTISADGAETKEETMMTSAYFVMFFRAELPLILILDHRDRARFAPVAAVRIGLSGP